MSGRIAADAVDGQSDDLSVEPLLNLSQLAQIFGTSENTITKWRAKGMPVEQEGGNGVAYGFLFSACKAWHDEAQAARAAESKAADDFVREQRALFLNVKSDDLKAGMTAAQLRDHAQAELASMQAGERRRSLVQVDEMVDLLDMVFTEVRAGLDGLPDWLEREFSLTGEDVERAVAYNDEILKSIQAAISKASLGEREGVVDPLDQGFL